MNSSFCIENPAAVADHDQPPCVELAVTELIFNLLCICRQSGYETPPPSNQCLAGRQMHYWKNRRLPRLAFWFDVLWHTGLLDENMKPTPLVPDWLSAPASQRFRSLAYAWGNIPITAKRKRERLQIILDLEQGRQAHPAQGLALLGLVDENGPTILGKQALQKAPAPEAIPAVPWEVDDAPQALLRVPYPPNWSLLWTLEAFLDPLEAGLYALNETALRGAVQRGALAGSSPAGSLPALAVCLEQGSGKPAPAWFLDQLQNTASARLLSGLTVEFWDPQELANLRQNWRMREQLSGVLSPRHLHLDGDQALPVLRQLRRRGVLAQADLERASVLLEPDAGESIPAGKAARGYLLYLVQLAQLLPGMAWAPPPGLKEKLLAGLEPALTASALRKARQTALQLQPPRLDAAPPSPAAISPQERDKMLEILAEAIRTQTPVNITYHTTGRDKPETRHVTPLMIEHANGRDYLLAYCHLRRDNRIFRLDRLVLLSE